MLAQRQNLEMICNPSDYFIHVSKAGEDRKQLSMADTVGVSGRGGDSSHFLCKACIISAHNLIQGLRCVPWLYKSFNPVCIAVTILSTNVEFEASASKSLVTSVCLLWWILSFSSISCDVYFQVPIVVIQSFSRVSLCDPTDCSTSDSPGLQHLPEFAQTHVHWVGDAIQPSHPLSAPYDLCSLCLAISRKESGRNPVLHWVPVHIAFLSLSSL